MRIVGKCARITINTNYLLNSCQKTIFLIFVPKMVLIMKKYRKSLNFAAWINDFEQIFFATDFC